jgi:hypothetical protein
MTAYGAPVDKVDAGLEAFLNIPKDLILPTTAAASCEAHIGLAAAGGLRTRHDAEQERIGALVQKCCSAWRRP